MNLWIRVASSMLVNLVTSLGDSIRMSGLVSSTRDLPLEFNPSQAGRRRVKLRSRSVLTSMAAFKTSLISEILSVQSVST